MQLHKDGSVMAHPFERAGLGTAPFKLVWSSVSPTIIPCAFCATSILQVFVVQGSGHGDKTFCVGCDCVKKTGDARLVALVESEKRKLARIHRNNREESKRKYLKTEWDKAIEVLKSLPHPNTWLAERGKTCADYYLYVTKNSKNMLAAIVKAREIA